MDELVGEPASKAGIGGVVAAKSAGTIPGFLRSEGPSDTVQARIDKIPGAEAAIATTGNRAGRATPIGGGMMAAGMRRMGLAIGLLASLGSSVDTIQNIACELFGFGRDQIGADQMGEIIAGTPGLSQFA